MKYDVFGIGSAIMDFLLEIDHHELVELNLKKGQFHLISEAESRKLLDKIKDYKVTVAPGGSSANTLYGVGILGGSVVFCGKVGNDDNGLIYEEKMLKSGIKPQISRSDNITGHAITFITPDSERTFAVHLGAAMQLEKSDIFFEDLKQSKILHIEGYQLEDKNLRDVSLHAMDFAKSNSIKISIDLGDPGIVERNKEDIKKMIKKYADIIFANEDEAKALTGLEPKEALNEISNITDIAVVKVGKDGSFIKQGDTFYNIPCYKAEAVDTTGAGDMFAAGVLYGITQNYNLSLCGHIGSYFASKVVEQIGARLDKIDKNEIKKLVENVN
ncbi:MAG: adenosine kinase [Nanoarchaeota archaeon]